MDETVLNGHLQELRRGTVVVASLAALRAENHGYRLIEDLAAAGINVGADTLYPLLRRMESQGLLTSSWNTAEERPRKLYATTAEGLELLRALAAEWKSLDAALGSLIDSSEEKP